MKALTRAAALALVVAAALPAFADSKLLTTKNGMTVYTFDKDAPGKSNCNDSCAAVWPPVSVDAAPSGPDISTITRADGSKQAAYKNQPIYLYAADQKPGDKTGDGQNNVWHAVDPGQPATAKKPAASSTDSSY